MKSTHHFSVHAGRDIPGGHRLDVELPTSPEPVPGVLLTPRVATPAPAALLLHGVGSSKERMADAIGSALLRRGVASLSIDLPLHGARAGSDRQLSMRNPLQLAQTWRMGVAEGRQALQYLAEHPAIDPRRLAIVGYSLGAFLGVMVASAEALCRALVVAAGGDLPDGMPFGSLVRTVADPLRAVRKLDGRPLLIVHGRGDRTIRPAQAERLYAAAEEPKELRWYQGGHWPPQSAIDDTAQWLADQLGNGRARKTGAR